MFGNTSKQLLHDVFANHKDYSNGILASSDKTQVVKKGIHCQCDNFVIESAFSNAASNLHFGITNLVFEFPTFPASVLFEQSPTFFAPRGPPAFA